MTRSMPKQPPPAQLRRAIRADAQRLSGEKWQLAAVLLASAMVGPSADRIARLLLLPRSGCRGYARQLRAHGLWRGRRVAVSDWWEKGADGEALGGLNFCLDMAIAEGYLQRVAVSGGVA